MTKLLTAILGFILNYLVPALACIWVIVSSKQPLLAIPAIGLIVFYAFALGAYTSRTSLGFTRDQFVIAARLRKRLLNMGIKDTYYRLVVPGLDDTPALEVINAEENDDGTITLSARRTELP